MPTVHNIHFEGEEEEVEDEEGEEEEEELVPVC